MSPGVICVDAKCTVQDMAQQYPDLSFVCRSTHFKTFSIARRDVSIIRNLETRALALRDIYTKGTRTTSFSTHVRRWTSNYRFVNGVAYNITQHEGVNSRLHRHMVENSFISTNAHCLAPDIMTNKVFGGDIPRTNAELSTDPLLIVDGKSFYPTTVRAHNIDPLTLVPEPRSTTMYTYRLTACTNTDSIHSTPSGYAYYQVRMGTLDFAKYSMSP